MSNQTEEIGGGSNEAVIWLTGKAAQPVHGLHGADACAQFAARVEFLEALVRVCQMLGTGSVALQINETEAKSGDAVQLRRRGCNTCYSYICSGTHRDPGVLQTLLRGQPLARRQHNERGNEVLGVF